MGLVLDAWNSGKYIQEASVKTDSSLFNSLQMGLNGAEAFEMSHRNQHKTPETQHQLELMKALEQTPVWLSGLSPGPNPRSLRPSATEMSGTWLVSKPFEECGTV